jgi:hypothetical protein
MTDLTALLADHASIDVELEDGDIVTDVVILMRVQRLDDTEEHLVVTGSEHTGAITRLGIVEAAAMRVRRWLVTGWDSHDWDDEGDEDA